MEITTFPGQQEDEFVYMIVSIQRTTIYQKSVINTANTTLLV